MLQYRNYVFKNIGSRIKEARKIKKETQEEFSNNLIQYYINMDRWRLSSIEKGKAVKRNNPHLLAKDHINGISEYMGCKPKELVFGKKEERNNFVKLVLLGIIMNGDKHYYTNEIINPFIDIKKADEDTEEFFRLAELNIIDESLIKQLEELYVKKNDSNYLEISELLINDCINYYKEYYEFFSEPTYYQNMKYLLPNIFSKELEISANLLVSLLFSNSKFAVEFMDGRFNSDKISLKTNENFINLIENKGQFGGFAIDWKEMGYPVFTKAFNEMWERNGDLFITYFENNLFNIDIEETGLKHLDDENFHSLITASDFQNILYKLLNEERYNIKTMIGHKIAGNYLEKYIIAAEVEADNILYQSGYTLYKYNHDIKKLTESYMDIENSIDRNRETLLLHVNDYFEVISFNKLKKGKNKGVE